MLTDSNAKNPINQSISREIKLIKDLLWKSHAWVFRAKSLNHTLAVKNGSVIKPAKKSWKPNVFVYFRKDHYHFHRLAKNHCFVCLNCGNISQTDELTHPWCFDYYCVIDNSCMKNFNRDLCEFEFLTSLHLKALNLLEVFFKPPKSWILYKPQGCLLIPVYNLLGTLYEVEIGDSQSQLSKMRERISVLFKTVMIHEVCSHSKIMIF